jgi:hypothetical protein
MRKAVAVLLGIAVLGVIVVAAVVVAPRAWVRYRIRALRSPDFAAAGLAFERIQALPAATLRRERAALFPALDDFLREAPAGEADDAVLLVGELLLRIAGDDGPLLLDARRFPALEPAAYFALARLDPAAIPRERCAITLDDAAAPIIEKGAPLLVAPNGRVAWESPAMVAVRGDGELVLATGAHPRVGSRGDLLFSDGSLTSLSAVIVDLGDVPLEDVDPRHLPAPIPDPVLVPLPDHGLTVRGTFSGGPPPDVKIVSLPEVASGTFDVIVDLDVSLGGVARGAAPPPPLDDVGCADATVLAISYVPATPGRTLVVASRDDASVIAVRVVAVERGPGGVGSRVRLVWRVLRAGAKD